MKAVIQRVQRAVVRVDGRPTGAINRGLLVFLGVEKGDTADDLTWLCTRIVRTRCFEDESGRMNRSVLEAGGGILLISQFTLLGSLKKGNRPSFNQAEDPEKARAMCEQAARSLSDLLGETVAEGVFAAFMEIESLMDGPVTLQIDSRNR